VHNSPLVSLLSLWIEGVGILRRLWRWSTQVSCVVSVIGISIVIGLTLTSLVIPLLIRVVETLISIVLSTLSSLLDLLVVS
jgi:hypothetical protein